MGYLTGILAALIASAIALQQGFVLANFQDETEFYWGADRGAVTAPDTVELRLNKTGGTGIKSTASYMYGSITMQIKLVQGNSAGTVTTFYLSSEGDKHDEIDFEFLGNSTGEPYTIHTNIFTQGVGGREEQFKPWFDATDGFHNYTILWDIYNVVWMVDDIPIRVFKNFHNNKINFPDAQPMKAYSSLWDAENWATQGGRVKTDWTLAPFVATLENYNADTCECSDASGVAKCSAAEPANWWTDSKYEKIDDAKISQMNWIRNNYMIYDYCTKTELYNATTFPQECNLAQY